MINGLKTFFLITLIGLLFTQGVKGDGASSSTATVQSQSQTQSKKDTADSNPQPTFVQKVKQVFQSIYSNYFRPEVHLYTLESWEAKRNKELVKRPYVPLENSNPLNLGVNAPATEAQAIEAKNPIKNAPVRFEAKLSSPVEKFNPKTDPKNQSTLVTAKTPRLTQTFMERQAEIKAQEARAAAKLVNDANTQWLAQRDYQVQISPFDELVSKVFNLPAPVVVSPAVKVGFLGKNIAVQLGNGETFVKALPFPEGNPPGNILGHTKNIIYFLKDSRTIVRWNLNPFILDPKKPSDSDPKPVSEIPLFGNLAGFTTSGARLIMTIQGRGLLSIDENDPYLENLTSWDAERIKKNQHNPNLKNMRISVEEKIGKNIFLENGLSRYRTRTGTEGFIIFESTGIYREELGKRYILNMDGFSAAMSEKNGNLFRKSWWVDAESAEGRALASKDQNSKLDKFLGAKGDRLLFYMQGSGAERGVLVILHLQAGITPTQIQWIASEKTVESFTVDEKYIRLESADGTVSTYDLSKDRLGNNVTLKSSWPLKVSNDVQSQKSILEKCALDFTELVNHLK